MLPESTIERVRPLLTTSQVVFAYYIHPLPRGFLSIAQGGLAVFFPASVTATTQVDRAQRLRMNLFGLMPPGHTEVVSLNQCRLAMAAAVIECGTLVFSDDESERARYEVTVLSRVLDFQQAARRFLGEGASGGRERV